MSARKILNTCAFLCLSGLAASTAQAQAQTPPAGRNPITAPGIGNPAYRQETHFTFSDRVQLPGVALEPGEYVFVIADPADGRSVVQVSGSDGKSYGNFQTKVVSRTEVAQKPEVTFLETPADAPRAIQTYWFPGQSNGREFVYSKEQTEKLAMTTNTTNTGGTTVSGAPAIQATDRAQADARPAATSGVSPEPQAAPSASAVRDNSQSAQSASAAPAPAPARQSLPRTASNLPFFALLGLGALMSAMAIRFWRLGGSI